MAKCANPSHTSSRSSSKLCRSTADASPGVKSSAVLKVRCRKMWHLLKMSSIGKDNLQAIYGRIGARIFMNWTNKGSSPVTAPGGKDEGGGGGGGWRAVPAKGERVGGSPVVNVQKRKSTKRGKARDHDCLRRPWKFAERPVACWIVPRRGLSTPGARGLGGGPASSATCAEGGLRIQC